MAPVVVLPRAIGPMGAAGVQRVRVRAPRWAPAIAPAYVTTANSAFRRRELAGAGEGATRQPCKRPTYLLPLGGRRPDSGDLPRAFRTADLRLIHPAICCSRYSSWTCRGVRYWSPECLRFELYQNSMYLTISRYACSRVGYWVR